MYLASFVLDQGGKLWLGPYVWQVMLREVMEQAIQGRALGAKHECTDRGVQE